MLPTVRAAAVMAAGALPALLWPRPATVLSWILLVVLAVLVDALLAASPRRIELDRTPPLSVRPGEPTSSALLLTNAGTRTLRGLVRDAWPPSAGAATNRHRVQVPAGERRRVRTGLLATRRGRLEADLVTIRSVGPLGLGFRQRSLEAPASIVVLPPFRSRRHLPSKLARLREIDGQTTLLSRGQGTEFDSLREYVDGDDVRSIDWRASARGADVVVRTWRPERDRRVLIVIDVARLSAARLGEAPRLDAQIEAALLLAALATKAGDRVDLVAVDTRLRARVSGQAGPQLMSALAHSLATVEPSLVALDTVTVTQAARDMLSQRSLVVLMTALDPSSTVSGLLPAAAALARDHTVVLASASDPETAALRADRTSPERIYDAAAAEREALERRATAERLRRRRVEVVEAEPEDLAPALADKYLALKAAGRL
ncbi:DUF58 domain-containing protein [Bogoriella caseilytica]|uniref:Uncharacterized protein (DUF58 family) n=1 Tax=Bogoriella caseilytica TaxID=56055 RepID=A0A3N2BEP6_9MICO|nr:DUF58 domain-containing protein [Bogoriella caseilytica]ROR73736.1 uncharacterized protein (DUF58 family) [Bogoriella caseilytica]